MSQDATAENAENLDKALGFAAPVRDQDLQGSKGLRKETLRATTE